LNGHSSSFLPSDGVVMAPVVTGPC